MLSATQVDQKIELAQLEAQVEKGLQSFFEAGRAWQLIKEKQLYSQESFKAYLKERWGITVRHADRLMSAFTIVTELREAFEQRPIGLSLPTTESQVRPLTQLPSEQRSVAWEAAAATSQRGVPTAAEVEAAVKAVKSQSDEWQPNEKTTVLAGPDEGLEVTVLSTDANKPLVLCEAPDGTPKSYLTTQLAGHTTPPPVTARPAPKAPPKGATGIEALSAKLAIESGRLEMVEESAAKLVQAGQALLLADYEAEDKTYSRFFSALKNTARLLGIEIDPQLLET